MRSLSFFFVLVALGFAYGCGPSPEGAREELDERGYDYSRQGLVEAVRDDDREAIELFISAGFNFSRSAGQAAIGVASEEGYNDMVRLLVDAGAKPDTEVLERTVEEGDWELSEILLEAGAKPSVAALESALEAFEDEDANEKVMQMLSYADRRLPAQFLEVVSGRLDEEYAEELVEALLDSGVRPSGDALERAAESGNTAAMTMLLEAGAKPSGRVLEIAIESQDLELVSMLLEAGARPSRTLLDRAMDSKNSDLVAMLMDAGARAGGSALVRAVEGGDMELVKTLLESGTKPSGQALERAVATGDSELVQALLDAGATPSAGSISRAVESSNNQLIEMLLAAGAVPDEGALGRAVSGGDKDLVGFLLNAGAKPGGDAIERAVEVGDKGLVDMLLAAGAKATNTALEKASRSGNRSMIETLLDAGAQPSGVQVLRAIQAKDTDLLRRLLDAGAQPGPQSFAHAVEADDSVVVEMLLGSGAEPSVESLQSAVENGSVTIVRLLLDAGVKPNVEVLSHAVTEGNSKVVEQLLGAGAKPTDELLENALFQNSVDIAVVLLRAGIEPSKEAIAYAQKTGNKELADLIENALATWVAAVQERWANGQSFYDELSTGGLGPTMVVVPAGRFQMGCKDKFIAQWQCSDNEQPAHEVNFRSPFAVSKFEITFTEWDACVAGGGCRRNTAGDQGWGRGNRPVVAINWDDAQSYVNWLSVQSGEEYRLPSEAEWEYFARAGTDSPHSWETSFIRTEPYPANCRSCNNQWSGRRTAPVGSFTPNPFGLHDLHGNVWEWVQDCWNDTYTGAPIDGSAWLGGNCQNRVNRGGSFADGPHALRSAKRGASPASDRFNNVGFRVVRKLTP